MINEERLDNTLLALGHDDYNRGTAYIRDAVKMYRPGMMMTKELYPGIARLHESTPARVERSMRHSIGKAWQRGSHQAQLRFFGYSIDPQTGVPCVGEYVARLARLCHEAETAG